MEFGSQFLNDIAGLDNTPDENFFRAKAETLSSDLPSATLCRLKIRLFWMFFCATKNYIYRHDGFWQMAP